MARKRYSPSRDELIPKSEFESSEFSDSNSIEKGVPLKEMFNRKSIELIGKIIGRADKNFDSKRFVKDALANIDSLEMKERAGQIARCWMEQLPEDFDEILPIFLRTLGPELGATEGNGMAPFFYFPHSQLIESRGVHRFESGMRGCYELTKRFTSEFCVRPFLVQHTGPALKLMRSWTEDNNAHVRRLVSEGTRPRLPWGMRLKNFQVDPSGPLELLELLKDDVELYVRRSVANHLGDVLKDHPKLVYAICDRWLVEISRKSFSAEVAKNRKWMIRHAVRLPAKKGEEEALALRLRAK